MARKKVDIKKSILVRVRVLYILFFLAGVTIAGRILWVQYGPQGDELRSKGEKISYKPSTVEADRGDILSRDGRILATSVPMYQVRMDFNAGGLADSTFNKNVDSLARCLSSFFGDKSAAAYKTMLVNARANRSKNRYTRISPRRVNHIEIKEIEKFPLFKEGPNRGGFIKEQINQRMKPHGSLASRTIGAVPYDTVRRLGIEGNFDSILRGVEGNVLMQRVSGDFWIPVPDEMNVDPVDGIDVVSTLDVDVQDVAESALRRQLVTGDADWGTAVLMEVSTGQIHAIANLTRKGQGRYVEDFNYAVGSSMEPGSTFKLPVLMTLLDDAGASLDEKYDTRPGRVVIGPATVQDTHDCGVITLREVFEQSSNVGFAKAVNKYYADKPGKFVDHLRKMGLGKDLGLQIAGEGTSVLRTPGKQGWDGTTLTMMSFGYALRLTPLQTLTFYNGVANGGKMVKPLFVSELRQYGQTLRTYPTEVLVSSMGSQKVVKQVQDAMKGVVEEGTGKVLKNPLYSVAAKTGTAQVAQGSSGYTDQFGRRHYLATLVGYFPADNPKYTCIVAIQIYNRPGQSVSYYGAALAGPVFRAIADRVYAQNTSWQVPVSQQMPKTTELPPVKGGRADEVKRVTEGLGIPYPAPPRGTDWMRVRWDDSLGRVPVPILSEEGVVPRVTGMGLKEALYLMEKAGLSVTFSGVGRVRTQSVQAGERVPRGTQVVLQLGSGE